MPPTNRRSTKNIITILCGQCKLQVEEEDDSIQCDKCSNIYHALCTELDKRQYDHLLKNDKEEYVCHLCNECGGNLKKELTIIKTQLKKLNQLDELQESMQFMSKQFDSILKGIADNKKKLEVVQKENKNLRNEIKELKSSVKFLNDSRVRNDCVINGLEVEEGVDAVETMMNLMKDVGVELQSTDINVAYFLKTRRNLNKKKIENKKTMIVKFNNNKAKQAVMSTKPKFNEMDNTKSIYINDFLSKETLSLLNHARSLRTVGYRGVYARSGKIYVKRSELSKPRVINDFEDVDSLLLEATTKQQKISPNCENNESDSEDEVHSFLSPN